jgi:Dna[CI] antecedent, DciA
MRDGSQHVLSRLTAVKQRKLPEAGKLGVEMITFFKQSVEKRQGKLAKIAECWGMLVPEMLNEHCSLEGLSRGVLTVLVDSSSHLYELKQLLLAGLEKQILLACKGAGLRKIMLRSGRWYSASAQGRKLRFD